MLSKNKIQDKNPHAHIKCHSCAILGHLASGCPNKLEKKAQANYEKQGNKKHQMSKEEKAQQKRRCYLCRERGHMAYSCPLGNNSKPISIDANIMLRKDGNGTSFVTIAKHPAIHTKALPKYVAPNLRGPNLVWVPSKRGWMCVGTKGIGGLIQIKFIFLILWLNQGIQIFFAYIQPNAKSKQWSPSATTYKYLFLVVRNSLEIFVGLLTYLC